MQADAEGFLHPHINITTCSDCDRCRQTCPVSGIESRMGTKECGGKRDQAPLVYAAWHLEESIRNESSSGGVFTAIADTILALGGVVVGAAFDDNLVVRHILIEKVTDLHLLRGSKYVQSEVSPTLYHQISDLLKRGRPVLFSGTPCQVAAIHSFLDANNENLFCCDVVCHGVPSPLLFSRYIQNAVALDNKLINISFRDKTTGWKNCSIRHHFQNGSSKIISMPADPYMMSYLRNYVLRPSCYVCKFSDLYRLGDLTIADFWGVAKNYPEYDHDDKGTSLVLVNTKKGKDWLEACRQSLFLGPADIDTAIAGNQPLVHPCYRPSDRDSFYHDLIALPFPAVIRKYRLYPPSIPIRIIFSFMNRIKRIFRLLIKR